MTGDGYGRLTFLGGPEVEATLTDLVSKATKVILRFVPKENLKTLVLAGGYGRGEGGIRKGPEGERPANNLDLLLFSTGLDVAQRAKLAEDVNRELDTLRRRSGMGLDFSVVDAAKVARDRVRVLWYDVRHGHKLLAGDPDFLPGLKRFTAQNIDPREMADLVINRGALLVLNDLILADGPVSVMRRETILTHAAKAVIGFGDALLFFAGRYHWSYAERRRRMAFGSAPASPEFRALYEEAMEYRFTGDEDAAESLVRQVENGHLRKALAAQHLEIERLRLGQRRVGWHDYIRASLRRELGGVASSPRNLARGVLTLVRGSGTTAKGAPVAARLGLRASGTQGAVRALFPLAAFGHVDAEERPLAKQILGVEKLRSNEARMAWLRMWGRVFDPNLVFTLKRLGLTVEAAA